MWAAPEGDYDPSREFILALETLYEDDGTLPEFTVSTIPAYVPPAHRPSSLPAAQDPSDMPLVPNYSVWLHDFPAVNMEYMAMEWNLLNDAKAALIAKNNNKWTEIPRGMETLPKVHRKLSLAVKQRKRVRLQYDSLSLEVCPVVYTAPYLYAVEFKYVGSTWTMRWLVFLNYKIRKVKILWDEIYMDKGQLDLTRINPVPEEKIQWFNKREPYLSVYLPEVKMMESPPDTDDEMSE